MPGRIPIASGALCGALAGTVVGALDGWRSAWLVGLDFRATLASVALGASVDALAGWTAGVAFEAIARLAAWGRRSAAPAWALVMAWTIAGLLSAGAAIAVVFATMARNNRFLAAGLIALAAVGAALFTGLLAPALARALDRRRGGAAGPRLSAGGLLLVPAVAALLSAGVFLLFWRTRPFVRPTLPVNRVIGAGAVASVMPWLLAAVSTLRWRLSPWLAAGVGALIYGGAAVALVALSWTDNLRFAPWVDIAVGAAIVVLAAIAALFGRRWLPARSRHAVIGAAAAALVAVLILLPVSASEPARKAGLARAGLVSPMLAAGPAASGS